MRNENGRIYFVQFSVYFLSKMSLSFYLRLMVQYFCLVWYLHSYSNKAITKKSYKKEKRG